MADRYTETTELKIGFTTSQNKTQYLTLENPNGNLSESEVKSAAQYLLDNKVLFDKDGEEFVSVLTAYTENKTRVILDIS